MSVLQASLKKYNLIDVLYREIEAGEEDDKKKYQLSGIRVPMIQRDYAQGRKEEGEVRKRFLDAIFRALETGKSLELDFVYGSIATIDDQQFFIPLDGQQRLTTLFLLYWYIGNRELEGKPLEELRSVLAGFSYETRISARDFCEKLSQTTLTFNTDPSHQISNAIWFYDLYRQDPTVAAMLLMLDEIHKRYEHSSKQLFEKLSKLSFYVLPLDGFNLTDELYIKMNARGKSLTHFENLKADLIKWLQQPTNPHRKDFESPTPHDSRIMPYHLAFALKLDNEWTNLFWNYSKKGVEAEDKVIDSYVLNFWNRYLLNEYITQSPLGQDTIVKQDLFVKFSRPAYEFSYDGFDDYEVLFEKGDTLRRMQRILDQLSEHHTAITALMLPAWKQTTEAWGLFSSKISQTQRILFLAITRYLEKYDFDKDKFRHWMRVTWNIIADPDIRSIEATVNIIRLIDLLSAGAGDIYSHICDEDVEKIIGSERGFAKNQLEEERLKAELILSDGEWEPLLMSAERHGLFQGNIGFLLFGEPTKTAFAHRRDLAVAMFNANGPSGVFKDNHLLMRSLIAMISNWESLSSMSFLDRDTNWQLTLRRNVTVRPIIAKFCDLISADEAEDFMQDIVKKQSMMAGWSTEPRTTEIARRVHQHLYNDQVFHNCLQQAGAVALKWHNDHIYVYRPRSWYDQIMLDTYRNELALAMVDDMGFKTEHRFRDSNYFWGYDIQLHKPYCQYNLEAVFDDSSTLTIGVKDDGTALVNTPQGEWMEGINGWQFCKTFDYFTIVSEAKMHGLLSKIQLLVAELDGL